MDKLIEEIKEELNKVYKIANQHLKDLAKKNKTYFFNDENYSVENLLESSERIKIFFEINELLMKIAASGAPMNKYYQKALGLENKLTWDEAMYPVQKLYKKLEKIMEEL